MNNCNDKQQTTEILDMTVWSKKMINLSFFTKDAKAADSALNILKIWIINQQRVTSDNSNQFHGIYAYSVEWIFIPSAFLVQ